MGLLFNIQVKIDTAIDPVGSPELIRHAATKAIESLCDDNFVLSDHLEDGDIITSGTNGVRCFTQSYAKPKIIYARNMLHYCLQNIMTEIRMLGWNNVDPANYEDLINELIQGMIDSTLDLIPFVTAGDSHFDLEEIITDHYINVKVTKM